MLVEDDLKSVNNDLKKQTDNCTIEIRHQEADKNNLETQTDECDIETKQQEVKNNDLLEQLENKEEVLKSKDAEYKKLKASNEVLEKTVASLNKNVQILCTCTVLQIYPLFCHISDH
jgi:uncharacterized protein (DUF3084 family)